MDRIASFIDTPMIKVITGMRRCGKSVIMETLANDLKNRGIPETNILYINFESIYAEPLMEYTALHSYIIDRMKSKPGRAYILLDEIQMVNGWEKVLGSLKVDIDCDIIVTGSNSGLLSGELATLISGRYIEIKIYPLSFAEYMDFAHPSDRKALFYDYLRFGGLPGIHDVKTEGAIPEYVMGIFNTVILKDVISRKKIRDTDLLERITRFAMDNIGNITSAKRLSDYLKAQHRSVGGETVYNYLYALRQAMFLEKVERYDIKGKRRLETLEKYYLMDHGLREAILGNNERDIEGVLENIVCIELLRRGYKVMVGRVGEREIDFVCEKSGTRLYVQVAYLLATEETVEREFGAYANISDNYPKYVVTMDEIDRGRAGILHRNIIDFLLGREF
jgi:predicted AAA+ superfamily ATPase